MSKLNKCPQCKSTNVQLSRAKTTFCSDCYLSTTKKGRVERMFEHPDFDTLGYKVKSHEIKQAKTRGLLKFMYLWGGP